MTRDQEICKLLRRRVRLPEISSEQQERPKAMANYTHRRRKDGLYDSICMSCFMTVAVATTETNLAEIEEAHICDTDPDRQMVNLRSLVDG